MIRTIPWNTLTLSREAKKEILKVHLSYIREQLGVFERCYREGDEKVCDFIKRILLDSCIYLKSIKVLSIEKSDLLTDIIYGCIAYIKNGQDAFA